MAVTADERKVFEVHIKCDRCGDEYWETYDEFRDGVGDAEIAMARALEDFAWRFVQGQLLCDGCQPSLVGWGAELAETKL